MLAAFPFVLCLALCWSGQVYGLRRLLLQGKLLWNTLLPVNMRTASRGNKMLWKWLADLERFEIFAMHFEHFKWLVAPVFTMRESCLVSLVSVFTLLFFRFNFQYMPFLGQCFKESWSASVDPTWIWNRRLGFEWLLVKVHRFRVGAFPLDKCSWDTEVHVLQWDTCKCTTAGSKLEICCLGNGAGVEGAFWCFGRF